MPPPLQNLPLPWERFTPSLWDILLFDAHTHRRKWQVSQNNLENFWTFWKKVNVTGGIRTRTTLNNLKNRRIHHKQMFLLSNWVSIAEFVHYLPDLDVWIICICWNNIAMRPAGWESESFLDMAGGYYGQYNIISRPPAWAKISWPANRETNIFILFA